MQENNHTTEIGYMMLWGELIKDCADDIGNGIAAGHIDPETLEEKPARYWMTTTQTLRKMHAINAIRFLRSEQGSRFCDILRIVPSAVIKRGRELGKRNGGRTQCHRVTTPRDQRGGSGYAIGMIGWKSADGFVEVTETAENSRSGERRWKALCGCGATFEAAGGDLRRGRTTSCGCRHIKPVKKMSLPVVRNRD